MTQLGVRIQQEQSVQVLAREATRLYFIDHWRAALTILVVLHHVALVYGAAAPYYYVDPPPASSLASLALFVFVLFNQGWFMGAFFFLAGYFTPGSLDRKGTSALLQNRLIRLGLPLLLFTLVLGPLSDIGLYLDPAPLIGEPFSWQSFRQLYPEFVGLGVAWFLALLLVFDFGYAGWRALSGGRAAPVPRPTPGQLRIAVFVLGLAMIAYLFRIVIPMGRTVLGFPTLAYLPQYLSFFVIGALAYRGDWLRTLPGSLGKIGFAAAAVASLLLFPAAIASILTSGEALFLGGGTWQSAAYALWDSTFAVGLSLASAAFFRRYFNAQSDLGSFLAGQSYAVYILHSPIVVAVSYGLYLLWESAGVGFGPLVKFAIAGVLIVPITYLIAALVRHIPGVDRVL